VELLGGPALIPLGGSQSSQQAVALAQGQRFGIS
jgi:hypothetical protein